MGGLAITNSKEIANRINDFQQRCLFPRVQEIQQRLRQYIIYHLLYQPNLWWFMWPIGYKLEKSNFFIPSTTDCECQGEKPVDYTKRMPNAMARLGLNQLNKLGKLNHNRQKNAKYYGIALDDLGFKIPQTFAESKSVFLRYPVWVDNKSKIVGICTNMGISIGVWFSSVIHPKGSSLENAYYEIGSCPIAEAAVEHVVNLPTYYKLRISDIRRIIEILHRESNPFIP